MSNIKLLGQRIYISLPPKEESKLIVDENTKDALNKELIKKMSKLTVHSVGDAVTSIKEGDVVLVDPNKIANAQLIPLSDDELVMLITVFDVIHVW